MTEKEICGLRFIIKFKRGGILEASFTDDDKKQVLLDSFPKEQAQSILRQIKEFVKEITLENVNIFKE